MHTPPLGGTPAPHILEAVTAPGQAPLCSKERSIPGRKTRDYKFPTLFPRTLEPTGVALLCADPS